MTRREIFTRSSRPAVLMTCTASILLAACGGGSGDGGGESDNDNGLITGESTGREASEVDTDELRRHAVTASTRGLGPDLGLFFADDATDEGSLNAPGGELGMSEGDMSTLETAQDEVGDIYASLLGIDDQDANVVREGNIITIDPDDEAVCNSGEFFLADDDDDQTDGTVVAGDDGTSPSETDISDCVSLVSDLTVKLDARTEDTGIISFMFQNQDVVTLGYSPTATSNSIDLAGVRLVLARLEAIATEGQPASQSSLPATMRGVLRSTGRLSNETEGSEAGVFELEVSETLELLDENGIGLTLAPSRVFQLSVDKATDEVGLSLGWGALDLVAEDSDDMGNTSRRRINLDGLSFDVTSNAGSNSISIENVGLGNSGLNIEVDSQPAVSVMLEPFGVTVNNETGELMLDSAATVSMMLNNMSESFDELASDYTASFQANVPASTSLRDRGNTTEVLSGGPVTASFVSSSSNGSQQSELSASVGSCFGERGDGPMTNGIEPTVSEDDGFERLNLVNLDCPESEAGSSGITGRN